MFRLRYIVVAMIFIGIVLVYALVLARYQDSQDRNSVHNCAQQLSLIGRTLDAFGRTNGRYPRAFSEIVSELDPKAFVCWADPTSPTNAAIETATREAMPSSYLFVGGVLLYPAPPGSILAIERTGHHRQSGTNVLYSDGHVEWVPELEANGIREELMQGHNPPLGMKRGRGNSYSPMTQPRSHLDRPSTTVGAAICLGSGGSFDADSGSMVEVMDGVCVR